MRIVFSALGAYFLLQVFIRTLVSPTVDIDQAEQVVYAQKWLLGYGPAPPLYTWLQKIIFLVLGESVLALALLKNLLLFGTLVLTYFSAQRITQQHTLATLAAISLFLAPQIAWESQRDLTHTVLASTMAAFSLFCLLQVLGRGRILDYVLLGLSAGLGLLSKYNFALWFVGLLAAALSIDRFRLALLHRRTLVSLGIALLIIMPHVLWALSHPQEELRGIARLHMEIQGIGLLQRFFLSFKSVAVGAVSFVGPILLVYAALLFRVEAQHGSASETTRYVRLLWRTALLLAGMVLVLFFWFNPTNFRERWLQPLLIFTPILITYSWRKKLGRIGSRRVLFAASAVMAFVAFALPARVVLFKREGPLLHSYSALAAQLRPYLPAEAIVVGEDLLMAGNLRLVLPEYKVIAPEAANLHGPPQFPMVLVWDVNRWTNGPQKELLWFVERLAPDKLKAAPRHVIAAASRFRSNRVMRWGFCTLEQSDNESAPVSPLPPI